jgi:ABC-2 type transport system ATP-binding protein
VLDEPTAGVDIELRKQLWDYVRRLNARGTTIVLTTHYLEEAQEMCDRIAIIDHGAVVACDTKEALLARIDERTLVVTPEVPLTFIPDTLRQGPRGPRRIERHADGRLAIAFNPSRESVMDVLGALSAADVRVKDLVTQDSDLEDIFLELTKSSAR